MILVEGVCLSYGLLVAPICPGNSLQAVEVTTPLLSRSRLLTATSLGIVWSSKARTIPLRPGTCVGVSEMGEALATQSRMALMAPGGLLVGIYLLLGEIHESFVATHFLSSCDTVIYPHFQLSSVCPDLGLPIPLMQFSTHPFSSRCDRSGESSRLTTPTLRLSVMGLL